MNIAWARLHGGAERAVGLQHHDNARTARLRILLPQALVLLSSMRSANTTLRSGKERRCASSGSFMLNLCNYCVIVQPPEGPTENSRLATEGWLRRRFCTTTYKTGQDLELFIPEPTEPFRWCLYASTFHITLQPPPARPSEGPWELPNLAKIQLHGLLGFLQAWADQYLQTVMRAAMGWFASLSFSNPQADMWEFPNIRGTGTPFLGDLTIRILLFRVLY